MRDRARGVPQFKFEDFGVDTRAGELRKQGIRIKLQERPFLLLVALLERPGETVTREELRQRLWPDGRFVDFDHSISSCVNRLRVALNDSAKEPRFIETVGRRGYRFIAGVTKPAEPEPVDIAAQAVAVAPAEVPPAPTHSSRRWLVASAVLVLVIVGVSAALLLGLRRKDSDGRSMMAVLPFENLTGDPSQDYFSEGLTQEMISHLGQLEPQKLGVIARASVMRYKNNQVTPQQIGADLGVEYVLEGSVRRDSEKVRIAVQLVRVKDQSQVWTRQYDRELSHLLALQSEIAQEVANEIRLTITDKPVAANAPPELSKNGYEAYDLYLKGRYFWDRRTAEGFSQAVDLFQQAINKDPNYARAYAGLADAYAMMDSYNLAPPSELIPKARAAALHALELDEGLAEAHTSLALIAQNYDWDWQSAEKQYRRAIQLDPNYATAHQWYAESLAFQGRFDEALVESERARRLDPVSAIISADCGAILLFARRYDAAIEKFRAARELDPQIARAHLIAPAYAYKGDYEKALAETRGWKRPEEIPWALANDAFIYSHTGQQSKADRELIKLEQLVKEQGSDPAPMLAAAYAGAGKKDKSLDWLEKAFAEHSIAVIDLKVNPAYDSLRSEERFQKLLHGIGF